MPLRLLVALAIVLGTAVAEAGSGVGIVVTGEPTLQGPLAKAMQGWLARQGYPTVQAAFPADAQTTFVNCFVIEDLTCARGVFEQQANGDHVVLARAELGANKVVTITAYWFARGKDAAVDKHECPASCNDDAMTGAVDNIMANLARSSGVGKGRLRLSSTPNGLVVLLDGTNIGTTPIDRDIAAGAHRIALVQGGQTVAERSITVQPDETAEITLSPRSGTVVVAPRSGVFPAILIGVGVAAVATGSVLIYYGTKGGTEDPYVYRGAMPAGIGTTAGGAAMLVVGTILWLRSPSTNGAPVAATGGGTTMIGWSGRF